MGTMIGDKTREQIKEMVGGLVGDYMDELNDAYRKAEDSMTIAFNVKIKPNKNAGNDIDVGINFVADRVKDSISTTIDEDQMKMFSVAGE
jgi:uncharacterized protein YbjQ (UPF0145 family)